MLKTVGLSSAYSWHISEAVLSQNHRLQMNWIFKLFKETNVMSSLLSIRTITRAVVIALSAMLVVSMPVFAQNATSIKLPNIVLVHGAWADGSSWSGVIKKLQTAGYNVIAPQFPLSSLQANEDRLKEVLASLTGSTILVGHSYGGQI